MKKQSVERLVVPGFSNSATMKGQWPVETRWATPTRMNLPKPIKGPVTFAALATILAIILFSIGTDAELFVVLGLLTIGIGALSLAGWCLIYYPMYKRKVAFRPDRDLASDEYLVVLRIFVNGALTGIDEGLMGIDGNLLFFTGAGCSFSLGSQDFGPARRVYPEPGSHVGAEDICTFSVVHPNRRVRLEVTVIETSMVKVSLTERLKLFQERVRPATLPRSFPPLERPTIMSQRRDRASKGGTRPVSPTVRQALSRRSPP